ncbi:MAG: hypothetical protein DRP78_06740 [Candidatus Omnitrophota bacterium]|nr:MAG: hypothetical protein DRP78_06740 [Candidatus Omnitrophota bacterium]
MRNLEIKIKIGLISIFTCCAFIPVWKWMYARFFAEGSFYEHGCLIPFISGYLIFNMRKELKKLEIKPEKIGMVLLLVSLLTYIFALYFEIHFISGIALIGVICGLVLYNCGKSVFHKIGFALLFLIFMVPLPNAVILGISFYMKLFVANIAAYFSHFFIPLKQSGSMVYLPNGVLTIGAPCSGLKSLITLSALSLLFAYLTGFRLKKKVLFFLCALPIALCSNILRIILLIFVFYVYGSKFTMGWFHDFSGILLFIIAFLSLTGLKNIFLLWPEK